MKTLKQIRADHRVAEVRDVSGEDFSEGIKYEMNLADGFRFDDYSHLNYARSVKELNELLDGVEVE